MVFDRPPKSFNQYVVLASAATIHADGNPVVLERLGEIVAGKLCPLVRVEDLRHTISAQRLIEGMYAEIRLQGIGKPPGQDSTTVPVHDNAKIHKSPGHRDIGDVAGPHLIDMIDRKVSEQIRVNSVLRIGPAGVGFWVNRFDAHQPHKPLDPLAVDLTALSSEMPRHRSAAV